MVDHAMASSDFDDTEPDSDSDNMFYTTHCIVIWLVIPHLGGSYFSGFIDALCFHNYGRHIEEASHIAQTEAKYVTKATLKPNSMLQCESF